ncbi:hydantoinase/oxoprolinase family protein [Agrobacterium sp. NPDC090283]|uniref:hydantoinase/oxoprolinase family protein n=1 Tax=Agrobacterium sp. NPDC090283 TaxID=3363920 RepID=UPI00383AA176
MSQNIRVAVDTGGTFTDICIVDEETGKISIEKTSSTPGDPIRGIIDGVEKAGIDLNTVNLFCHGTTVATNALITRNLPRTVIISTEGFRDVLEIRRGVREDIWDAYKDLAPAHVKRRDRLTVEERVDATGKILTRLNEEQARKIAKIVKRREVGAVAICFINAYLNGQNEQRMREIILEEMPGVPVSISSEVLPEISEYERFVTTVINAATSPVVSDYVSRLGDYLAERGYKRDLLLLHSGGGVMTPASVRQFSARLAGSGIAAGALASRHVAMLAGFQNSIGLDMGGTSTDVSMTYGGDIRVTRDWHIEWGYPIRFPAIEVLTIGAGGGSLAWTDPAGSLHNGPQSAGSNPGPACYDKGNSQATNTDANVVLGRQGPVLAGGKITLNAELAKKAVDVVATQHNYTREAAADAIIRVANANMADAVRLISVARGYDPRDFALVAFGGAGALHGVDVARELSIPVVIVPPNPGVTSAWGCLLVDVQHDFAESYLKPAHEVEPADLEAAFRRLETTAIERLHHEGISDDRIVLQRSIDMMYEGQWRTLTISAPGTITGTEQLTSLFHLEYEREYDYRRDDTPVDFFRINLKAIGQVEKAELPVYELVGGVAEPKTYRDVWFGGTEALNTPIFDRDRLAPGMEIAGPAIVEQFDSTIVVPPRSTAAMDKFRNLIIRLED